jgi:iron-sulfur cluster assembly accessory protein
MSLVTVTPSADQQISNICKEDNCYAVSLNIKGGGCAGFEYEWKTIEEQDIEPNDVVVDCAEGKFVVGAHSLMFLLGSEVDYKKDLMGSMFHINNPNAQSSCGCGVSINFNIDELANPAI